MKTIFFDTHSFDKAAFDRENSALGNLHQIFYIPANLSVQTAPLAKDYPCVCVFVNDRVDRAVVEILRQGGTKLLALRSAGFNNVDLTACKEAGIKVVRVPAYSPYAVAEHTLALILSLNRKIHRAYSRVREHNFSLDGLVGFDLNGRTIGILGTGKIGTVLCRIMHGLGLNILAYDPFQNKELIEKYGVRYTGLEDLFRQSDIVSLQLPLTDKTRYIINEESIKLMKQGVIIINTGRGALINTKALINGLKKKHIGGAGLDVYEEEEGVFFKDLSGEVLADDTLARLLTFPNVVVTAHQAFLTEDALTNIASTTLQNISEFERGDVLSNEVG